MCKRKASRWTDYVADENENYYDRVKCRPLKIYNDADECLDDDATFVDDCDSEWYPHNITKN